MKWKTVPIILWEYCKNESYKNRYLFPFIILMFTQHYDGWVDLTCDGVCSVNMTITWQYMTQNWVCMTHYDNWVLHTEGLTHFQINLLKHFASRTTNTLLSWPLIGQFIQILASDWPVLTPNAGINKVWVGQLCLVSPLAMVKWYGPSLSLVRSGHHWLLIGCRSRIMLCKLWEMQNNILCWMKNYLLTNWNAING